MPRPLNPPWFNRWNYPWRKVRSCSFCSFLHPPVTSSLFGPNIFLSTLFSNTLSIFYWMLDTNFYTHGKTVGRVTALHVLIFTFLDSRREDGRFWAHTRGVIHESQLNGERKSAHIHIDAVESLTPPRGHSWPADCPPCHLKEQTDPVSQTFLKVRFEVSRRWLWSRVSSGMLRPVALVRTDVSEERSASFIRVTRIGELGTTLAVTSNRRTLRR
jgi:hypothetical protein